MFELCFCDFLEYKLKISNDAIFVLNMINNFWQFFSISEKCNDAIYIFFFIEMRFLFRIR